MVISVATSLCKNRMRSYSFLPLINIHSKTKQEQSFKTFFFSAELQNMLSEFLLACMCWNERRFFVFLGGKTEWIPALLCKWKSHSIIKTNQNARSYQIWHITQHPKPWIYLFCSIWNHIFTNKPGKRMTYSFLIRVNQKPVSYNGKQHSPGLICKCGVFVQLRLMWTKS